MSPVRVVAPIRVNRGRSSRRLRAAGLAQDYVELEVLHGRVEDLLHRPGQAVDLVDEQDVPLAQVGQQRGQVARPDQGRPRSDAVARAHLVSDDARQ